MSEQVVSRVLFPEAVTRFRDNGHSSSLDVAIEVERPTREPGRAPHTFPYLVLLQVGFTKLSRSPGRLVSSYLTLSPLPPPTYPKSAGAVSFLWHFPSRRRDWALPSTLPCEARTFLSPAIRAGQRPFVLLQHTRFKIISFQLYMTSLNSSISSGFSSQLRGMRTSYP
jgi:hypothetical protein